MKLFVSYQPLNAHFADLTAAKQAAGKVSYIGQSEPQRLKPDCFAAIYGTSETRALPVRDRLLIFQQPASILRSYGTAEAVPFQNELAAAAHCEAMP